MTPEEFTRAKLALGLNNTNAAAHLVRSRRTIQRYQYASDDPRNSKIPELVVRVIRHWLENREITLEEREL